MGVVSSSFQPFISATMASADLIWMCVKKNSSFLRKSPNMPVMTAEPGNLSGLNSYKFSGLTGKTLDVSTQSTGKKETVSLTQSHKKASRQARPASMSVTTGLKKSSKKGLAALDKAMDAGYY